MAVQLTSSVLFGRPSTTVSGSLLNEDQFDDAVAAAVATAITLTSLTETPTARWAPQFSSSTVSDGRVVTADDMMGFADLTGGASDAAPIEMVDANGRKFWRFEGAEYLNVAQSLTLSTRNMAVFMVGRFHRISNKSAVFSLGNAEAGNASNTLSPPLEATTNTQSAPLLRAFSYPRTDVVGIENLVVGSQMQVVGVTGRPTADGGSQSWVNETSVNGLTQPYSVADVTGAEIGRFSYSPGGSGWGTFDMYEMVVYDRSLTPEEGDTVTADFMEGYGIIPVTNQLVLEGDSIMQGTGEVTSGIEPPMLITNPGESYVPEGWRVVSVASSGATISNLTARRDADRGWVNHTLSGENVLAFEIGRNDMSTSGGIDSATHYSNVVSYLTDGTKGPLTLGWDVRTLVNIASATALEPNINGYRALIQDPDFLTDLSAGTGQAYDGRVSLIETHLIEDGGNQIFFDVGDSTNTTYYAGDSTHPTPLGAKLRMTGGDDPTKGVAYGL